MYKQTYFITNAITRSLAFFSFVKSGKNLMLLLFITMGMNKAYAQSEKPRVFILTDIENEPDDEQSLIRLLTYSNQFDIEGLVATTSVWLRNRTAESKIHSIVDSYAKVRDNLEVHEKGFPTAEYLKGVIKSGIPKFGMEGVGEGQDSPGSDWLIECLKKEDNRPVYIQAWGGANVLAQALWKMKESLSEAELEVILKKIRVYTISDQDDAGPWIRNTFPSIFYVVSPGFEENGGGQYHYATWTGIAGDKLHGRFNGPDFTIVDNPWLDEHVRNNHGPLGAVYPHTTYMMEGDTPAFLGLIDNGLNNAERPDYGGWGGRYELYIPPFKKYMYEAETRPIWTDAQDEVYSEITESYHTSNHATIWRWREAYQHDFAARMDWSSTSDYTEANHPPIVKLAHNNELTVKAKELVVLKSEGTNDPDGDQLTYEWMHYKEPGTFNGHNRIWLDMDAPDKSAVSFKAPKVTKEETIHFILIVKDDGIPALTRYQRVIVKVLPN